MKAVLVVDVDVDLPSLSTEYVPLVTYVARKGSPLPVPVLKMGTTIDGDKAVSLCKTGQASPDDADCSEAVGMTPEQLKTAQRRNLAAQRGISGKNDLELFMAGVIEGYEPGTTDQVPIYKPGPKWADYQAALKDAETTDL